MGSQATFSPHMHSRLVTAGTTVPKKTSSAVTALSRALVCALLCLALLALPLLLLAGWLCCGFYWVVYADI